MAIKAVVFDIGNVLLEWHPEAVYDAALGPEKSKAFFEETQILRMNELVDLGAPFQPSIHAWADLHPKWREEILMWETRWIDMASPAIAHSARLMERLQAKGIPVFSLTNFGVETYDMAAEKYPFMRAFDRDFISGHMRMIKPDPAIYKALEDATGLDGPSLIFTDDRPDNIAAAKDAGWRTHLFEHAQGWADRLVAEGLLTAEEAS
jgi:2-haloacid dehalogenase